MTLDVIIHGGYVLTMEGPGSGMIPNGAVAIRGDSIVAVGPAPEILKQYSAHRYVDAHDHAVLPGLIDCHIHTSNAIVRGGSQDIAKWMYSGVLPLLSLAETEDLVAGSMLNIIEAVKKGTTTFCDYDFPMLELIKNHIAAGTRVVAAEKIRSSAEKMNLGIHMHVAQSPRETRQVMQRYGKRPVELLDELGYLDRRLHTAHITETTAAERALLAERGVSMALCTGSIGIINGEIPPAQDYMALAGRVGLGTDQAPGNNCNNLFNEMKFTSILHKVKNTDPTSFPAWKVLRMATIEAAQCMGMEESVGSLRAGKKADVVLVALDTPAMSPVLAWPVRNIVPNLVYSASGSEVDTVLIDGAFVVENGRMRTIDEDAEIKRANRCAQLLCQRLEATGWEKDMPLAGWTREGYY